VKKYRKKSLIIFDSNEGSNTIYNPNTGNFYEINEIAAFIWSKLDEWVDKKTLKRYLLNMCIDAPSDLIETDVDTFLQELQKRSLVDIVGSED
jgi:hypothetical protein